MGCAMKYKKTCTECGEIFHTEKKIQVTCGEVCREQRKRRQAKEWRLRQEHENITDKKICIVCGKPFEAETRNHTICSDACRDKRKSHWNKVFKERAEKKAKGDAEFRLVKKCEICGTEIIITNVRSQLQKYCSPKCKNIAAARQDALRRETYSKQFGIKSTGLTDRIARYKAEGLTYAEGQIRDTLKLAEPIKLEV